VVDIALGASRVDRLLPDSRWTLLGFAHGGTALKLKSPSREVVIDSV
jgi:hypothetical protein